MSRIGKNPIKLDRNITIRIENQNVFVKGPKGDLKYTLPEQIKIKQNNQELVIQIDDNNKKVKQLYGLSRTLINNMIVGVSKGFNQVLEIHGVGYRAQLDNKKNLILNVGYSHPVQVLTPQDINIQVENNNTITVHGIDKSQVGQVASQIRAIRPPEPYKGKGIRYQNEIIKKKVGKAGK